jgi:hypothetical protein
VITNLRADPYERAASQSGIYIGWYGDNVWLFVRTRANRVRPVNRFVDR